MEYIAENITIKVGEQMMVVNQYTNGENICIDFKDEDLDKMPNGYCFEGYENELIITPFKPQ